DRNVTGVQTCALPIFGRLSNYLADRLPGNDPTARGSLTCCQPILWSNRRCFRSAISKLRSNLLEIAVTPEPALETAGACQAISEIGRASCRQTVYSRG